MVAVWELREDLSYGIDSRRHTGIACAARSRADATVVSRRPRHQRLRDRRIRDYDHADRVSEIADRVDIGIELDGISGEWRLVRGVCVSHRTVRGGGNRSRVRRVRTVFA